MVLIHPSKISEIDKYASDTLGIPVRELMRRAGEAVARAVREYTPVGGRVAIFAGKGNNGGDGYAAACLLKDEYDLTVYDVFSAGQRTDEGRYFLSLFESLGGSVQPLLLDADGSVDIPKIDCAVDAIFGTGFGGELPEIAVAVARKLASLSDTVKIAVDVPLGVNAADGRVDRDIAYHDDATVVLGFIKTGLASHPAKEYVGKMIYDNIGLHNDDILAEFPTLDYLIDYDLAADLIPKREENTSKGSFGKLLMICGSMNYRGAARLALEAALRGGVGYVTYAGEPELCDSLLQTLPEAIYKHFCLSCANADEIEGIAQLAQKQTAVLIGPGSTVSDGSLLLLERLFALEGAPLVLDADAINALARHPEQGRALIRNSRRAVILTPHPLELSRISGITVEKIQSDRLNVARAFAQENNCILVLKGAATVVTDGATTYINSSGSSALAKAGSGDVLAGFLASVLATGQTPLNSAALAVYFHGLAADALSEEYSALGVIPSDLPKEICRQIARALKSNM